MTISFEHEAGSADDAAPGAGLAKPLVATRISYSANLSALLRLDVSVFATATLMVAPVAGLRTSRLGYP